MSDQPFGSGHGANVSPVKKNPRGKLVSSRQKETIINVYKTIISENPDMTYKELIKKVSTTTGVGKNSIQKTIADYKKDVIRSPNKTKFRANITKKVDDFQKRAIRKTIHDFWFRREIPSLNKILNAVNDDPDLPHFSRASLYRLIKDMQFVYSKRGRNSAMIEKDEIVIWRNKYLEQIRKYRAEGRTIYYLGETCVNVGDVTSKIWIEQTIKSHRVAERLIVGHIGSEEGFVPGGLLSFKSKKNTSDNYDEMNGDTFFDWIKGVLPLLQENCVIVMDNAPYHSVKAESCPTMNWKKVDIEKWLEEKGEVFEKPIIKIRLMEIVKRIMPAYNKYVIDEYVKEHNRVVLRFPHYHCELNPIEMAWSVVKKYVKINNTTFKLPDVQKLLNDGIYRCTSEMWKNFVEHVKKEENICWDIDFIVDEVMENGGSTVMTITGETSSDSDSDF